MPADDTPPAVIAPSTPVAMSLRTFFAMLVAIVTILGGIGGAYYALAATDKDLGNRQNALEERFREAATRHDLRKLRLGVREDLLNSRWLCEPEGRRSLRCRIVLKNSEE